MTENKKLKENEKDSSVDPKTFLQGRLFPLLVVAECITILLSFSDKFLQFADAMRVHFYLINTLLLVTALLLIYHSRFKNKNSNLILYALVALLYGGAVFFHIWEVKFRKTGPAVRPDVNLGLISLMGFFEVQRKNVDSSFAIDEFYLNDQLCSFTDAVEYKFGQGPEKFRTFSFNQDVNLAFKKGCCVGLYGNQPIKNVLPILNRRLENIHRQDLKEYIKTPEDLSRIIASRGDIFKEIMFTDSEIQELKKTDSTAYVSIRNWLINCIGIKNPVITLTLENTSNENIIISKIVYDVSAVGQVKGGETGALYPIITYDHFLEHRVGLQERKLEPGIQMAKQAVASFNIRLIPTDKSSGFAWVLRIRVYDAKGNFKVTEPVQIIMSK